MVEHRGFGTARRFAGIGLLGLAALAGCGGGAVTSRYVDTPKSTTFEYGAPSKPVYEIETEAEHERLRIYVYQFAQCDKIPVTLVERREEVMKGGSVVETRQLGTVQIAKPAQGTIACDATYARDLEVSLMVAGASYPLGRTDAGGAVEVDVAAVLERGVRDEALPEKGDLHVRSPYGGRSERIGSVALRGLAVHEEQLTRLLAELEAILGKGAAVRPEDITRSYVVYEQLRRIAPRDPRFRGLSARFWELLLNRKQDEASDRLGKNLKALDAAKAVLKDAGFAAIPIFAQVAANSGAVDARAVEWSQWQLLSALRASPALCGGGGLRGRGLSPSAEFATLYLEFVSGDGFGASVESLCARLGVR